MGEVRKAVMDDAEELVRLRGLMLAAMDGVEPAPGPWQRTATDQLRGRLADPSGPLVAYVVDKPGRPSRPDRTGEPDRTGDPDRAGGLAACAVGVIEYRLASPDNPTGEVGYVFNVVTDPGYRRRGYSRACMEALLDWYRQRGVSRIDLRASAQGEPLYRALGFTSTAAPALRLNLETVEVRGSGAGPGR